MFKKIAVFGAGTMGTNIAQEFAVHGFEVNLYSRSQQTLDTAKTVMEKGYALLVEEGMFSEEQTAAAMQRICFTRSVEDCADGCDIVMETISEIRDAKRELFAQLDAICGPEVIFTSDTSALNIYELVPESRQPTTLITHYFAPAHLIPLVELVKGPQTRQQVVDDIKAMYTAMNKIPIVVEKVVSGFIVNRLQAAIDNEVNFLMDEGYINAEGMDLAVKSSLMLRGVVLGVVQKMDFTGLDSRHHIRGSSPYQAPKSKSRIAEELYEKGDYGVKTGRGFYDYGGRKPEDVMAERDRRIIQVWRATEDFIKGRV